MSRAAQLLGLAGWLGIVFVAAAVGAIASLDAASFYGGLLRPSWAPPAAVFGPVWTALYLLMAVAAWMVWRTASTPARRWALVLFVVQLALNALWSWLFFAWYRGAVALGGILLLWVLIAATDPVSVIAAFREMGCIPRLSMLVESESLLNDGVAAVGFAVLSAIAAGASPAFSSVVPSFLWTLGGGVLIGVAVSAAILLVVGRTSDPLVEITLTTIAAYGSFLIAEHVHASGIISALAAGLMIGSVGAIGFISEAGRDRVQHAWEYFAFLANSFVFILIGMNEANQPLHQLGSAAAGAAILLVLAGRAVSVYPVAALFSRSRWRLPAAYQHILVWGGLRGALALALALAVPATVAERNAIIITAFVVVAFSILVQGLTMPMLIKRFGLAKPAPEEAVAAPAAAG